MENKIYKEGDIYGTHRVISPKGVLPQPADKIDNTMEIYDNEVLIDVHTLNIDSASFTEIERRAEGDVEKIKEIIMNIVETTGKHKNPWTGSGGMLIGKVKEIGPNFEGDLRVGDKIATLVSLSLTPLRIDEIKEVRPDIDQVDVRGQAVLFQSGLYGILPGDTVVVMGGGGKSGILCCWQAKKQVGINGKVICVDGFKKSLNRAMSVKCADEYMVVNATDAVEMYNEVMEATDGELADVVINVVNIPNTEMASIMACKDGGMVYFFSMATDFTKAALGAEGVGKDVNMLIGNGYTKGHANAALQVLREDERIMRLFAELYA